MAPAQARSARAAGSSCGSPCPWTVRPRCRSGPSAFRPSRMNPNTCTVCELQRIMKARKIPVDVSILFADLRGYTALSQSSSPDAVSSLLDAFYDECAEAIWEYDGLLNKTIGDSVMAIFNFPIQQPNHAEQAVRAAHEIQRRCEARRKTPGRERGP